MIDNNEYEKLVKEGYIEAGSLVIRVDDITKIELSPEQVKSELSKQGFREDKQVVLVDAQGRTKKLSSLMFGYNKQGVKLADGSFANSDDLLAAMENAINGLDEGTIVVDRKGNPINPTDLLRVVEEAAGKVKIGERSTEVQNQNSRYWSVEGANSDIEHKKGIVFLGKHGPDLKSGDYVSVDELLIALNEYVIMKPVPKEDDKEKQEEETKVIRVTRKYKNNLSRWLIMLAALLVLLSGIRVKDNVKTVEITEEQKQIIVMMMEQQQLEYGVEGITREAIMENLEEAQRRIASGYKIGDEVELQQGDVLYENSLLGGQKAVIGSTLRQPGNYEVTGVSIVCGGQIFDFHIDLTVENPGFEIGNFINEACEKHGLNLDDVQIRLHFGNSANHTQTGWIDVTKLIKEENVEKQVTGEKIEVSGTFEGIEENFNGTTINMETPNGVVTIKVVDENGNLLQPGAKVIGSDGQEYMIGELNVSTIQKETTQEVTTMVTTEKEVVDGKKVTWKIQDCSLLIALGPLIGAAAAEVATRKKNEEAQELPYLDEFETEADYITFRKEFKEAKEKYEKTSGFGKMIKRVFFRQEYDVMQNLTMEQVQKIYATVRTLNNSTYRYNEGDQIKFKNGRIVIITKDQKMQDITDLVIPMIAQVGRENEVVEEGLLPQEEENENGIHL